MNDTAFAVMNSTKEKGFYYELFEKLPFSMGLFDRDGGFLTANSAFYERLTARQSGEELSQYNIFTDPLIATEPLLHEQLLSAFRSGTDSVIALHTEGKMLFDNNVSGSAISELFTTYSELVCYTFEDRSEGRSYVALIFKTQREGTELNAIKIAKCYIAEHWQGGFRLADVAKEVNFSVFYFSRLFKKQSGMTPYEYYARIKTEMLKAKLRDLNLSLTQVLDCCGLKQNSSFLQTFKRNVGMSPTKYRESLLPKNSERKGNM